MTKKEENYIDIDKLLVKQFKEQLEFENKQREKDEHEFRPDKRKKLKQGGTVMARGQGRLSELIKPTKIY